MKKIIFLSIINVWLCAGNYYKLTQEQEEILTPALQTYNSDKIQNAFKELGFTEQKTHNFLNHFLEQAVYLDNIELGKSLLDLGANPFESKQSCVSRPAVIQRIKNNIITGKHGLNKEWLYVFALKYPDQKDARIFSCLENESAFILLDAIQSNNASRISKVCEQLNLNEENKQQCLRVFLSDALGNHNLDKTKMLQTAGAQLPSKDAVEEYIKELKASFAAKSYKERIQFYEEVLKLVTK